jgi:hypothetical protein
MNPTTRTGLGLCMPTSFRAQLKPFFKSKWLGPRVGDIQIVNNYIWIWNLFFQGHILNTFKDALRN